MLRKTLATLLLGLLLSATDSLAGRRYMEGTIYRINYDYANGRLWNFQVGLIDAMGRKGGFDFQIPVGSSTDLRSLKDVGGVLASMEAAYNNYLPVSVTATTSDSKNCTVGTTGCDTWWTVFSGGSFYVTRLQY